MKMSVNHRREEAKRSCQELSVVTWNSSDDLKIVSFFRDMKKSYQ
jgi:hypothetical protein